MEKEIPLELIRLYAQEDLKKASDVDENEEKVEAKKEKKEEKVEAE